MRSFLGQHCSETLACWYPVWGISPYISGYTSMGSGRFREIMVLSYFPHLECFYPGTQTWKVGIFLSLIIAESFRCESVRADTN